MLANLFQRSAILCLISYAIGLRQKSFYDRLLTPVNGCSCYLSTGMSNEEPLEECARGVSEERQSEDGWTDTKRVSSPIIIGWEQ